MNATPAIERAIRVAGSQQALANALGIKSPSISEWKAAGRVPPGRVLEVERLTGVSRHDLNPELYPREATA